MEHKRFFKNFKISFIQLIHSQFLNIFRYIHVKVKVSEFF